MPHTAFLSNKTSTIFINKVLCAKNVQKVKRIGTLIGQQYFIPIPFLSHQHKLLYIYKVNTLISVNC